MLDNTSKESGEGGYCYEGSTNRWRCWYYIKNPVTLKKERKKKSFLTEEEAKNFISSLENQKESTLFAKHNGIPLNALIKANIERKADLGLIGDNQYNRLNRTLRTLEKWGLADSPIDKLKSDDIQEYLNSLRDYSNSYITKISDLISNAFTVAMNKGYIRKNPMSDVIRPRSNKQNQEIRAMTLEEEKKLSRYLINIPIEVEPYKTVYLIQMFMGLRIGEALALKSTDIDLQRNMLSVKRTITRDKEDKLKLGNKTKTYAGKRNIPIDPYILDSLIEQMKIAENHKDNLLFTTENDTLVHPNNANNRLKRILHVMGIEGITTHSLRHTYATRCIEAGMQAVTVQRLMGHKDISVTLNTYTTIFDKYKEQELAKVNEYYLNNAVYDTQKALNEGNKILDNLSYTIEEDDDHKVRE